MSGEAKMQTDAAEREEWVQRYLLAELDADEVSVFERRLGRDKDLAQALADGVALFAAVADLPVEARPRWTQDGGWPLRVAAAAVLLIAATLFLALSSPSAPEGAWVAQAGLSDQQADQVLSLWLASVDEEAEEDEETDLIAAEDAEVGTGSDPAPGRTRGPEVGEDDEEGEEDEWDIPEWLLLGVRAGR